MAKAVKKTQELTLEQVLWNCRVDLRGVGSLDKNRDAVISLVFLKFAGDKFEKRRKKGVVDKYNTRDNLIFTSEVVADFVDDLSEQLMNIINLLKQDKTSFEKLGITFEEKAFYDILIKVRDTHGFPYEDAKCLVLAKEIKKLVDDKAQYADWSTRDDIKSQLNMDLIVLLYENGYPPEWNTEVYEKVLEQAENFRKYSD